MDTIKTPAILQVKDEKHHVISHTIIDYEQIDTVLNEIKDILKRNNWHHEITVAPSQRYFHSELAMKDVNR